MTTEVIILYTFQAILGVFGPCIAYLPVKYLNQKALGMQTVFDQMMKDLLYLIIFKSISVFPILALIVEFLMPVNHYLAIAITIVTQFSNLVILWQYVALIGVRFLSVFHPTYLQNENLIKTITRCFIGFICLSSILSSDLENNTVTYNYLSGKKSQASSMSKPYIFSSSFCIIAQIIVQYKLEIFKKTVDSLRFDAEENQRRCEYGTTFYTHRVEFVIMACPFLFVLLLYSFGPEDVYFRRLILTVFLQIIFLITFPVVIISKNDNMRCYIAKLIGQFDVSKNYIVNENRMHDTLHSGNLDQEDKNYSSITNFHDRRLHEPIIPGTDPSVIQEHGAPKIPISDINLKDRSVTSAFHHNKDNNSISNIEDPMPGCSHW